jgi:hypothetical protein
MLERHAEVAALGKPIAPLVESLASALIHTPGIGVELTRNCS